MIYLLDTNVISETVRHKPDSKVISWLKSIDPSFFSLSVITLGEIRKGTEKLHDGQRKQKLIQWLEIELLQTFQDRIIPITAEVADKWGYVSSTCNIAAVDGLIAASALVHNQRLVTRNVKDFKDIPGLEIINPWET